MPDAHAERLQSSCDVLIVEDEFLQAREVGQYLARAGLTIQIARDGAQALTEAKRLHPKVALVDCNLPDTNGFLVAKGIEEVSPQTAIIFVSGRVEGVPETLLRSTKARAFLNKPLPLNILRSAVLKLLRNIDVGADQVPQERGWLLSGIGSSRSLKTIN